MVAGDLYRAYFEARKHKRNKPYQIRFEKNLEENIASLCGELWSRTYVIRGHFMHINRQQLLQIAQKSLDKMGRHPISRHEIKVWGEVVDVNFIYYLTLEHIRRE